MIQSVSRALDILTVVSDIRGEPLSLSSIAKKTGLNVSTCAHLVETMCEKGFLSQVSRTAGYVLGAYAYYLTRYKAFQKELITTCNPALRWIQRRTGYTALLAILVEGEKFVISYAEDGKDILRERGELYRGNLYNSATGRAMLSGMYKSELSQLVEKIGLPSESDWPGVSSLEILERKLRLLANERWICIESISDGKYETNYGMAIKAPHVHNCAIGLHISRDSELATEERIEIQKALMTGMREINRRLRFDQDLI